MCNSSKIACDRLFGMAEEAVRSSSWDNILQAGPAELPKMAVVWFGGIIRKGASLSWQVDMMTVS